MRTGKVLREAYEAFGEEANSYDKNYEFNNGRYPDHIYRLRIFEDILQQLKPTTLLDAGCGSGVPLLRFLQTGFNAYGFDRSPDMVEATRTRLIKNGLDPSRVFQGDLDDFTSPVVDEFDAIVGLGSVYYTQNTGVTISNLTESLRSNGSLIFSLRNQLFSICSMNEYSADFLLRTVFPITDVPPAIKSDVIQFFTDRFPRLDTKKLFQNVDERNIRSNLHNPMTVAQELLAPNGLSLRGIYFYHFHALPPIFEHTHQDVFYQLSEAREVPDDWRGIVNASCFIVHAEKSS